MITSYKLEAIDNEELKGVLLDCLASQNGDRSLDVLKIFKHSYLVSYHNKIAMRLIPIEEGEEEK